MLWDILGFVIDVLLLPISAINIVVDWFLGIEVIKTFLNIVAYLLPWQNILPLITLIISIFIFRAVVSLLKTIWELLPVA